MLQPPNFQPGMTLEEMNKRCILYQLEFSRGNKTQAANSLGISIRTLDSKLEEYETSAEQFRKQAEVDHDKRKSDLDRLRGVHITAQNGHGHILQPDPISQGDAASEAKSAKIPEGIFERVEAPARVRVQPAFNPEPQHAVSVPKLEEVQKVLPKHASANRKRGSRSRV